MHQVSFGGGYLDIQQVGGDEVYVFSSSRSVQYHGIGMPKDVEDILNLCAESHREEPSSFRPGSVPPASHPLALCQSTESRCRQIPHGDT